MEKSINKVSQNNINKVYACICEYAEKHNYMPSFEDIIKITGIKSKSTVHNAIKELLEQGLIETDEDRIKARAYRITKNVFNADIENKPLKSVLNDLLIRANKSKNNN